VALEGVPTTSRAMTVVAIGPDVVIADTCPTRTSKIKVHTQIHRSRRVNRGTSGCGTLSPYSQTIVSQRLLTCGAMTGGTVMLLTHSTPTDLLFGSHATDRATSGVDRIWCGS